MAFGDKELKKAATPSLREKIQALAAREVDSAMINVLLELESRLPAK